MNMSTKDNHGIWGHLTCQFVIASRTLKKKIHLYYLGKKKKPTCIICGNKGSTREIGMRNMCRGLVSNIKFPNGHVFVCVPERVLINIVRGRWSVWARLEHTGLELNLVANI